MRKTQQLNNEEWKIMNELLELFMEYEKIKKRKTERFVCTVLPFN